MPKVKQELWMMWQPYFDACALSMILTNILPTIIPLILQRILPTVFLLLWLFDLLLHLQ